MIKKIKKRTEINRENQLDQSWFFIKNQQYDKHSLTKAGKKKRDKGWVKLVKLITRKGLTTEPKETKKNIQKYYEPLKDPDAGKDWR